jgi:hypothetical protein
VISFWRFSWLSLFLCESKLSSELWGGYAYALQFLQLANWCARTVNRWVALSVCLFVPSDYFCLIWCQLPKNNYSICVYEFGYRFSIILCIICQPSFSVLWVYIIIIVKPLLLLFFPT